MSKLDIVRAWKDEDYFNTLSDSERSRLPANPAGVVEIDDRDLLQAEGGTISLTIGCDTILLCPPTLIWPYCTVTITILTIAETQLE